MAAGLELAGLSSPEAQAALGAMLKALQSALRRALSAGPAAVEDPALWAEVEAAYAAYDAWIAVVAAANPVTCRAGCTACCHDNPHGVAGIELARLRRALAGREAELQPRVERAVAAYRALVAERGEMAAEAATRALRQPCPLLGAHGLCTAYNARPMACRMFYALTPPEMCDPGHPAFDQRVNPNLVPPLVIRQLLGALSRVLELPGGTLWEGLTSPGAPAPRDPAG